MGRHRQLFAQRKDGTEFSVEIGLSPIVVNRETCVMAFVTDISERLQHQAELKKIEQKLQDTAKLESLGVLAGGIAHDFNNILAGVLGNANLLEEDLPAGSPLHEMCADIHKSALRAAELCKQMLAYSGRGKFVLTNVDIAWLIKDTLQLIKASVSKKVSLEFTQEQNLLHVEVDVAQIRQVLMNLVLNGAEALGDRVGTITIRLGVTQLSSEELLSLTIAPPDHKPEFVFVEITDNGCGISPENLKRIFDPFFTTKLTGRGLGLAAVLGIIRGHKGGLAVTSELNRGTTFRLLLPLAGHEAVLAEGGELQASPQWRGAGTVLLADDEECVRQTLSRMLARLGFKTIAVADGREAAERFAETPDNFCLVILDLTMPEMDGAAAFAEMRKIRPSVKVLLISGYSEKEAASRFAGRKLAGFLQKPFPAPAFQQAVRTIVETPAN